MVKRCAAVVAIALLVALLGAAPSTSGATGSVLFVVGSPASVLAGEQAAATRLAGTGFTVTFADDATVTPAEAQAATFVMVGNSVDSATLQDRLATVSVPLWVAKPYLFDDYGLTGPVAGVDYDSVRSGQVTIAAPAHPLAAGRSGQVTVQPGWYRMSWGRPPPSAAVIATAGGEPTVFTIAAGTALADGQPAAGCRLTFPLFGNAPTEFTADGWALFDAAAAWAADSCADPPPPPPPPADSVLLVVGSPTAVSPGEEAVATRLGSAGFTVVVVDDAAVTTAQAEAATFVLISNSVNSATLAGRLVEVSVPVWVAKPYLFDDYGLTGPVAGVDYDSKRASQLDIDAPAHHLAAGRTGAVTVQAARHRMSWGLPAAAATVVATAAGDPAVFTIPAGAALADGAAAAGCRLTFPLFGNAPTTFTVDGWALFDAATTWAAGGCAEQPPADIGPMVVMISVDGLNPQAIGMLGPAGAPTLHRIIADGVSTLNARSVVELTRTLPNHSSMMSGRQVALPDGHGVTFSEDNGATIHASAGEYVASVFDVVHDRGGSTVLYAGSPKFDFFDRSWSAENGGMDLSGPDDDGTDKIDEYLRAAGSVTTAALLARLSTDPPTYSFIHYAATDGAGHASGFLSAQYLAAVTEVDGQIGQLLDAIAGDADLAGRTTVILTSDHGGSGFEHSDPTNPVNYTVPFMAWGAGVAIGADLYELNPDRLDPGPTQPPYTAWLAPIRAAEAANLALDLLGLEPITSSVFDADQSLTLGTGAVGRSP